MREADIQTKIKKKLQAAGWIVVKLISTNTPGIPDLMILRNGITKFIEVKQPGKKPTELQQHRMKQLNTAGFDAFVADKIEDVFFLLTPVKES